MFSQAEVTRPYPGLRPFEPHEAEIFFGRQSHVDRLLEILQQQRFLAVIGPSGCGKSSLVRAGLLPAVAAGWLGTGSDWRIAVIRPGDRPLRALARKLGAKDVLGSEFGEKDSAGLIETELARGRRGLIDVFNLAVNRLDQPRLNLLIVVDQFEELFTYARSGTLQADESADFVNLLLAATAETDLHIRVVLTMRTDFLGNCVRFLDLPDAVNRGMFLTPRLNRDEMRTAIVGPAALFGGRIDDQLAGELINGVGSDSDELPILQHALSRVWANAEKTRGSKPIASEDLAKIGGLERALSIHADAVFANLTNGGLESATKKLFQFITERTSPEDGSRDVRRPRPLKEIGEAIGCEWSTLVPIVEAYAADGVNFLTFGAALNGDSVIDISHEALIRKWVTLKGWVAEEAARAATYRDLRRRAATVPIAYLTSELPQAVRWRNGAETGRRPDARWAARYGPARDFDATLAYIARSEKEEWKRRRAQQWRRIALAFGMLAVIIGFAVFAGLEARIQKANAQAQAARAGVQEERARSLGATLFLRQKNEKNERALEAIKNQNEANELAAAKSNLETQIALAQKAEEELKSLKAQREMGLAKTEALEAKTRQIMSESQIYAATDPDRAQLLALEAYQMHPFRDSASMIRAVRMRYASLLHTLPAPFKVRRTIFNPDGKTVLTLANGGVAQIWEVATGHPASPPLSRISPVDATYNSTGTVILGIDARTAQVWDASTGRPIASFPQANYLYRAALSPNGKYVATATNDKTGQIWEVAAPKKPGVNLTGHKMPLTDIVYSPNGKMIATASRDKTVLLWDASTGAPLLPALTPSDAVRRLVFSPDSSKLLTLNVDKTAQVWNTTTGAAVGAPLTGHTDTITLGVFTPPDGKMIVTASADGTARSWDAATGKALNTIVDNGRRFPVLDVSFRRDGKVGLIASADGTAQLFDPEDGETTTTFDAHHGQVVSAAFSPDGKTIVTAHDDAARLWDAGAGRPLKTLSAMGAEGTSAAFTNGGKNIIATSSHGIALWDVASWMSREVGSKDVKINGAILSPDGSKSLTEAGDATIQISDAITGRVLATIAVEDEVSTFTFSGDGNEFLLATGTTARIWETKHGRLLSTLVGHRRSVTHAAFSTDGQTVVTASEDGTSRLWNAGSGRLLHVLDGATSGRLRALVGGAPDEEKAIVAVAFSRDGKIVGTADSEGDVRLWDVQTGHPTVRSFSHQGVTMLAFNADASTLITGGEEEIARLWDAHTGRSIATLSGHRGSISGAVFSEDGKIVATASADATIRLWDTTTGRSLAVLEGDQADVNSISLSPDGHLLLSVSNDGTAHVWDVSAVSEPIEQMVAVIKHRVGRTLTNEEREESKLPATISKAELLKSKPSS